MSDTEQHFLVYFIEGRLQELNLGMATFNVDEVEKLLHSLIRLVDTFLYFLSEYEEEVPAPYRQTNAYSFIPTVYQVNYWLKEQKARQGQVFVFRRMEGLTTKSWEEALFGPQVGPEVSSDIQNESAVRKCSDTENIEESRQEDSTTLTCITNSIATKDCSEFEEEASESRESSDENPQELLQSPPKDRSESEEGATESHEESKEEDSSMLPNNPKVTESPKASSESVNKVTDSVVANELSTRRCALPPSTRSCTTEEERTTKSPKKLVKETAKGQMSGNWTPALSQNEEKNGRRKKIIVQNGENKSSSIRREREQSRRESSIGEKDGSIKRNRRGDIKTTVEADKESILIGKFLSSVHSKLTQIVEIIPSKVSNIKNELKLPIKDLYILNKFKDYRPFDRGRQ